MKTRDGKKSWTEEKKIYYVKHDYKTNNAIISKHYIYTVREKKNKNLGIHVCTISSQNLLLILKNSHNFTCTTKCRTTSFWTGSNKIRVTISNKFHTAPYHG